MRKEIVFHFAQEQRFFLQGKIAPVEMVRTTAPTGWIVIDDTLHVSVPVDDCGCCILLPVKETEEFVRTEYKDKFGIDIPDDVHQWPYIKKEAKLDMI